MTGSVVLVGLLAVHVAMGGLPSALGETGEQQMPQAWKIMCQADVDSPDFAQAGARMLELVEKLPRSRRFDAAAGLMDRYADDNVNAAALELFGAEPFPIPQVRRVLFDPKRTFSQRVALRTYFSLCRGEYQTSPLSESARVGLVQLLTERIKSLSGQRIGYGEQRLLTHLCQSVLSRYARKTEEVPQSRWLIETMGDYATAAGGEDIFAASVRGWLVLLGDPGDAISSVPAAINALGHWDPLVRWKASRHLGRRAKSHPEVVVLALKAMSDPRDEVRAAAVEVFAVATNVKPKEIVEALVGILLRDRSVIVQSAASVALSARADHATFAIRPLLDAFDSAKRRFNPGRKRTNSILLGLASLARKADRQQKEQMLRLAVRKLPVASRGALQLLSSLGPEARSAVPRVTACRRSADRSLCHYIDRHVLPAINLPSTSPE